MRLVWWLATVLTISFISIALSEQGTLSPLRNLALTANAPVELGLRDIASPVSNIFDGITDRGEISEENRRLREELEALRAQLAEQQDAAQRIKELEDALGVKQSRPEDLLKAANVIAEDTAGFKRLIAIDVGQDDGLDEGMVVLSRNGSLVGTISLIYADFAWVRLITDPDSTVNAQVNVTVQSQGSDVVTPPTPTPDVASSPTPAPTPQPTLAPTEPVRALAKGDLRRRILLDLLPSDAIVARGDLAVTSGHGGNYPRGLLIGTIEDVDDRPQAPFKTATIEPAVDLFGLDTVLVLLSFKPARLTSP
jgi:rod shape-determining protein MreC